MALSWPVGRLSCTAKGAARGFLLECPQFVVADTIHPLHRQRAKIAAFLSRQVVIFTAKSFHPPVPFVPASPELLGRAALAFQVTLSRTYLFHYTVPPAYCLPLRLGQNLSLRRRLRSFPLLGRAAPDRYAMSTIDRQQLDHLERRGFQLTIFSAIFVFILAGGLATFMYPLVFLRPEGNKMDAGRRLLRFLRSHHSLHGSGKEFSRTGRHREVHAAGARGLGRSGRSAHHLSSLLGTVFYCKAC